MFPHTESSSKCVSPSPTHQAGWWTRSPGCRTSCWEAAPTRRSKPPQWMCSWCLGEDWPRSPSSPSGQPAEGRSRRSTHMAHTAWPHTDDTPHCRSGRTCPPCQTEQPTPRSVWTASGCRSSLEVETGALKRWKRNHFISVLRLRPQTWSDKIHLLLKKNSISRYYRLFQGNNKADIRINWNYYKCKQLRHISD